MFLGTNRSDVYTTVWSYLILSSCTLKDGEDSVLGFCIEIEPIGNIYISHTSLDRKYVLRNVFWQFYHCANVSVYFNKPVWFNLPRLTGITCWSHCHMCCWLNGVKWCLAMCVHVCVFVYREVHNLPSASWRTRKVGRLIQSMPGPKTQYLRARENGCPSSSREQNLPPVCSGSLRIELCPPALERAYLVTQSKQPHRHTLKCFTNFLGIQPS